MNILVTANCFPPHMGGTEMYSYELDCGLAKLPATRVVVLEAMAHGVPVVVSACAGAAERVTHGENGLIVQNPFDSKEIGALLNQLQDADLRRALVKGGKQLAAEYNLDRNSKEILEAVEAFSAES